MHTPLFFNQILTQVSGKNAPRVVEYEDTLPEHCMAIRYLYFVRHGQFDANLDDNPRGELSELGKKQAKQLIKAFKNVPVTCIHVSTAPRALQTADPLIE